MFSKLEEFPNVIREGMAATKPVITSNVSGIPILIKNEKFIFNFNSQYEITKHFHY